jgi:hypothetical protein
MANLITLAAESGSHESAGATPYLIGGGALVVLLALLFIVVTIGGGREHS